MTVPFEDPRKRDLRGRVETAIEAAGHDVLSTPLPIEYPAESTLRGRIVGDIQSVDGEEITHVYFVRPDAERPLPQWIHNTALASHSLDRVLVHIATDSATTSIEQGARACGAGLLEVTPDMTLDVRLVPGRPGEEEARVAIGARISELRIALRGKSDLNLEANQERFTTVDQITQGMPPERREQYLKGIEETDHLWRGWSERLSAELDSVLSSMDAAQLDVIEAAINAGAVGNDDTTIEFE